MEFFSGELTATSTTLLRPLSSVLAGTNSGGIREFFDGDDFECMASIHPVQCHNFCAGRGRQYSGAAGNAVLVLVSLRRFACV